MAAASGWGEDDPASGGEWTTVTRSGRSSHSGPVGCYPSATAPAAPRSPAPAAPAAGGVIKGVARLEIEDGSRRLDKYDIPVEVSGDGAPPPADGFEEAGLVEAVLRNVARCGYDNPTLVQRYSMPIVLSGRDLMACAQTGSGKTAAFCLPVVSGLLAAEADASGRGGGGGRGDYDDYGRTGRPRALVLAPTRELAAQIHEEAKKFSHQTGIKVKVAYGGTPMIQQMRDIERGVDILVATPGCLVDMIERSKVSLEAIKYLVMDEADMMLDMGFDPQIRKIVDGMGMPRKSMRQTMLFSATFPPQMQRLASDFLSKYIFITVGRVGSSTDLITQKVEFVTYDEKKPYLLDLLQDQSFNSSDGKLQQPLTLVFVETKRDVDSLRYWLYNKGFPATAIHGDRTQELCDIERGVDILVATPGRHLDMIERSKFSLEAIKYLVMDEADRMLDMGSDPQVRKIVDGMGMPRNSVRQTMLFSATFLPQIQRLASNFLSKYIFITVVRVGSSSDLITQKVEFDYNDYSRMVRLRALVLVPARMFATQIHKEANKFSHQTGIIVKVAYGGTPMFQQGVDILVATPGCLVDMIERSKVSLEAIKYLVMDEADMMLDMGFDPQIRKIVDGMGMPRKSMRQTMLFSATFPPQMQRLASDFLLKYIFITVGRVGSSTDLITQKVEFVTYDEKKPYLLDLLQDQSFNSYDGKLQQPLTLVFMETKRDVDSLRYWLYNKGFPATAIHGDRTQEERERALRSFKSGLTPIMVATGVATLGLDVPSVSHVINYDLPKSIEYYVHMIGRTGSAGCATAFFNEQNHPIAKGQLELMAEAKQNVSGCLEDYPGPLEITSSRPIQGLVEVMDQKICLQFDSKLTIEEVVSKVFINIGISFDYWVKINGRLAQLDCILSSLVPESDHDFSLYISPRMRGGAVRVPILDHIITFAENVFDVVLFPKELHYKDMTPYFLGLSSQSIEISVLLINLVHRKYPTRCPSHFTKEDILYNSKRNTLSFRADFEYLEYTDELYYQNLLDVATVFSEIFIYDENLLLSNSPAIHVHSPNILPTPLPHGWRRPMHFELLIHDLKQTVYQFVPLDISKNKDYFLSHLGILSDIARFAFFLACELDLGYDGNEHNIEKFVGLRSDLPMEEQDATVLEGGELKMEEDAEKGAEMEEDAGPESPLRINQLTIFGSDDEEDKEAEKGKEEAEGSGKRKRRRGMGGKRVEEDAQEGAEMEEDAGPESPLRLNQQTKFGSDDEEAKEAEGSGKRKRRRRKGRGGKQMEEDAEEGAEIKEDAGLESPVRLNKHTRFGSDDEGEAEKQKVEEAEGSGKPKPKRKKGKRKKVRQEPGLPANHIPVDHWDSQAFHSEIFSRYLGTRYEYNRLGSQWRCSRNWVAHGFESLNTMGAKQAEAFLQLIFEGLFYNVRLKLHFPNMVVIWRSSPCPPPPNARWNEDTSHIVQAWVRSSFTTDDHLKIRGH